MAKEVGSLLGDAETPFSIDSAQEAVQEVMKLIPKSKLAGAFGAVNEIAVVLADAKRALSAE